MYTSRFEFGWRKGEVWVSVELFIITWALGLAVRCRYLVGRAEHFTG